jgi:hypothetical protein
MHGAKNMCKNTRKTRARQCSMGGIYNLVKGTGQTQFSTKFAAKLSFMLQKKLIVRKET